MKRNKTKLKQGSQGFTIVETMIVLAVTGVMLFSVMLLVSGRQNKTQFQTAMNDIKTQIQQIGTEVSNGNFDTTGYSCTKAPDGTVLIGAVAATSSGECQFIGKALHFHGSNPKDSFSSFTIVGLDTPEGTIATAKPKIVPAVTVSNSLKNGLTAAWLKNGAGSPVGSFAFMQSLNKNGNSLDSGKSGASQHLNLVSFNSGDLNNDDTAEQGAIAAAFAAGNYSLGGSVTLCFNSGTTDQSGLVTISSESSQLDVRSSIQSGLCSS